MKNFGKYWQVISLVLLFVSCSKKTFQPVSRPSINRTAYVEQYKDIAIKEMQRSGIPASIKMAQAILESGDGNSTLAKTANNHFGIKCHNWTGSKIYHDDDAKNECFRKYRTVLESYQDHSDFILRGQRYRILFSYDTKDYKKWAEGLQKAGYATNPNYAKLLIRIIEDNNLHELDYGYYSSSGFSGTKEMQDGDIDGLPVIAGRKIFENNGIRFVIAEKGDSYRKIARHMNLALWEIYRYNDLPKDASITPGQKVYIERKKRKAKKGYGFHIVKQGETMYTISQLYGIRLQRLYKMNLMEPGEYLSTGSKLHLRSRKKDIKRNRSDFEFYY
jgi:LysM repeat protein